MSGGLTQERAMVLGSLVLSLAIVGVNLLSRHRKKMGREPYLKSWEYSGFIAVFVVVLLVVCFTH